MFFLQWDLVISLIECWLHVPSPCTWVELCDSLNQQSTVEVTLADFWGETIRASRVCLHLEDTCPCNPVTSLWRSPTSYWERPHRAQLRSQLTARTNHQTYEWTHCHTILAFSLRATAMLRVLPAEVQTSRVPTEPLPNFWYTEFIRNINGCC